MKLTRLATAIAAMAVLSSSAFAADFEVKMLNKDSENRPMQFEPAFLKVAPGDTVNFVSTDKGHDSESLANGIPEGATGWKGKISADVSVTLTTEGLYAYKCTPHFGLGMVGLIQVGDNPTNLQMIKDLKLPGKADARMQELLAEQASGASAPVAPPAAQ